MIFKLLLLLFIIFYILNKEKTLHLDKKFEDKSKYLKLKGLDYLHNSYIDTSHMIFRLQMKNANKKDIELYKSRFFDVVMDIDNFTYYKTESTSHVQYVNKDDVPAGFLKDPPKSTGHMQDLIIKSKIQTLISTHDTTGDFYFPWNHGIMQGLDSMKIFKYALYEYASLYEDKLLDVKLKSNLSTYS